MTDYKKAYEDMTVNQRVIFIQAFQFLNEKSLITFDKTATEEEIDTWLLKRYNYCHDFYPVVFNICLGLTHEERATIVKNLISFAKYTVDMLESKYLK